MAGSLSPSQAAKEDLKQMLTHAQAHTHTHVHTRTHTHAWTHTHTCTYTFANLSQQGSFSSENH